MNRAGSKREPETHWAAEGASWKQFRVVGKKPEGEKGDSAWKEMRETESIQGKEKGNTAGGGGTGRREGLKGIETR